MCTGSRWEWMFSGTGMISARVRRGVEVEAIQHVVGAIVARREVRQAPALLDEFQHRREIVSVVRNEIAPWRRVR